LSISDLLGSGAKPEAMLLGITLQHGSSQDEFEELMKGAKEIAEGCGVRVIGGDTKLGSCRALFSVGIGSAISRANLFLKNGAKPGDLLWCSGPLGSCNAATLGLQRSDFSDEWRNWAKEAILVPRLPLGKSSELSGRALGRGGTDISDGLGADLSRLCSASGTGAVVDALSIPFEAPVAEVANRMGVPPWTFAFAGGGDFQFLVSASKANRKQVEDVGLHLIGELTEQRDLNLRAGNRIIPLPVGGHEDVRGLSFSAEIKTLIQQIQLD
jgi:thiamine-monophosphate kinase